MFDTLSDKFNGIFEGLRRRGALSEADVTEALREVRLAMLDADVALPVVKDFVARVRARAVGAEVLDAVSPGQTVAKIVNDALIEALGGAGAVPLNLSAPAPIPFLMVGLQGSGKTTTSGKLALRLRTREKKRVLLASLDTQRPAAQLQLAQLAERARSPACRSWPAKRRCRSPAAPWRLGGARGSTSSSSTPRGGCRSTRR